MRLFSAEAHNTFFGNSMGAVPTTAEAAVALKQAALTIIGIHRFLSLLSANKLVEPNVYWLSPRLCLGTVMAPLGGSEHPVSVLSGRQPAAFSLR